MENQLALDGGGTLRITVEGPRVRLEAERREDGRGIYKVWIRGGGGGRLLLGTLVPERGRLYLRRSLPRTELERGQVWPVVGGETVLAFAFAREGQWYCEGRPGRLVQDPVVRRQLSTPMLCSRDEEGFRLAAPFRTDSPVALDTLLCLASVELLSGKPHLVWQFDGNGRPKVSGQGRKQI